jgi:hypothetical protein
VKASLVGLGSGFRRASAPMPMQSELERENILVTWKPRPGWSLGAGRQHFYQDSVFTGIAARATLNQLTGSATVRGIGVSGGWLVSEAGRSPNVSSYLSVRDEVLTWLHGEFYLLNVWQPTPARTGTPVLVLRELLSPQFSLLQVVSRNQGRTTLSMGGSLNSGLSSLSVDYQVAHSPYLTNDPFVQTMGVNARFHVFGLTLSVGTFVTPDGRVHYSGQGSTFLYHGMNAAPQARGAGPRFERFIVRGRVVDESGQPIDGAALEIGGDMVYTDSQGRFFRRCGSEKSLPLRVVLDDFLVPGAFAVATAPTTLSPAVEGRATEQIIVLRRLRSGLRPN